MKTVVILGAGFGGLSAAAELGPLAENGGIEVALVEKNSRFSLGFSMQWVLANRRRPEEGFRTYSNLQLPGVEFVLDKATLINTEKSLVTTKSSKFRYDFLLIALGAEPVADLVPGLKESAYSLCDLQSVIQLKAALERIEKGTVIISIASTPFKCPPAPYEYALLIDEILQKREVRDKIRLVVTTPEPQPMPVAGKAVGETVKSMLAGRGIEFLAGHKPVKVDKARKTVSYENGAELSYEILAAMPPHRAPRVVLESGLAGEAGFVPVDLWTMKTSVPNVYAVGDVASLKLPNGSPHPKAGVFAEAQGMVAARNIVAELQKREPSKYAGTGICYIDTGFDKAAPAKADLLEEGEAKITLYPASEEGLKAKKRFEEERFKRWFGG